MKKFLPLLFLIFSINIFAQNRPHISTAIDYIQSKTEEWSLSQSDVNDLLISSEVTTQQGITYLYLIQGYKGVPIRNAMAVVIIKDGEVVSVAQNLISGIVHRINTSVPNITPEKAILNAAGHFDVRLKHLPMISSRSDYNIKMYDTPELTRTPIPAQLQYELINDKLVLVWNLNLNMKQGSDYWDINFDANSGGFVSQYNMTIYCNHKAGQYTNHDNCSISTYRDISGHLQSAKALMAGQVATYNVYALPAESPNHGSRILVSDAQYPESSPFGWHDINGIDGPEYTITRGNNVYAFEDKDDDDRADLPETDGGNDLIFDFPIDFNIDPRESGDAAVTNLFYMCNMIHDISVLWGFTEEFGNFQKKNYTGQGDGDDYVLAQAFDGIELHEAGNTDTPKINNANFSSPIDGYNGRMQMYLWTDEGGAVSIDEPATIAGFINDYTVGQFGGVIPNKNEPAISGNIIQAISPGNNPTTACTPLSNSNDMAGNIALIDRGICDFSNKVYIAQEAGAVAAIICNISGIDGGNGEELVNMGGALNAERVTIPSIFTKKSICDKIRVELRAGKIVVLTLQDQSDSDSQYLDGSLDNGIIAHEYGHGISTRLTGGRLISSCLNNDEQMGEGWSDFFSLVLTRQPDDIGSDSRGIGTYASGQTTEGGGIRRYPYSTDMNINPQTYKDIRGTSGPHPLGEVWADILWDMYWNLVDEYGYNEDWRDTSSGNYKALFLVIEGMKIQGCSPNFVTGRNGIMNADSIYFNGENGRLLWETFARRGVGYYAEAGNTRNDCIEDFSILPTLIEKLKITKTASSSIDPGDEIEVSLHAINHIPNRQNNIFITDEIPDGLTYVPGSGTIEPEVDGNTLVFDVGDMAYKEEIEISYKVLSSKDKKSIQLEYEGFDDINFWDFELNKGIELWFTYSDIFRSPEACYAIFNSSTESDASLISIPYEIQGVLPVLRFWHRYNTEKGFDGGLIEISVDNGPFETVPLDKFIRNGYNSPLAYGTLALPNQYAFTGSSGGDWNDNFSEGPWIDSYINLSEYIGHAVTFKFRFASDEEAAASGIINGWFIDDFEIMDLYKYSSEACIFSADNADNIACTEAIETIVNPDRSVSTKETKEESFVKVKLLPNPAGDYVVVNIESDVRKTFDLSIINLQGKIVYQSLMPVSESVNLKTIDTGSLPSGFYLVRFVSGSEIHTEKLIIK